MSFLIRNRSIAFRIRDAGQTTDENFGTAHLGQPMLEWGSITKTVTARIAERLDDAGNLDLSAPVSDYVPTAKLACSVDVRSLVTHTSGLPRLPADMFDGVFASPLPAPPTGSATATHCPGLPNPDGVQVRKRVAY